MKTKIFLGIIPLIFGIILSSCSDSGTEPTKDTRLFPFEKTYNMYVCDEQGYKVFNKPFIDKFIYDAGYYVLNTGFYGEKYDRFTYDNGVLSYDGEIWDKTTAIQKISDVYVFVIYKEYTYNNKFFLWFRSKFYLKEGIGVIKIELSKCYEDNKYSGEYYPYYNHYLEGYEPK